MNINNLQPCPFCGDDDSQWYVHVEQAVVCNNCGAKGPPGNENDKKGAEKLWNKRKYLAWTSDD